MGTGGSARESGYVLFEPVEQRQESRTIVHGCAAELPAKQERRGKCAGFGASERARDGLAPTPPIRHSAPIQSTERRSHASDNALPWSARHPHPRDEGLADGVAWRETSRTFAHATGVTTREGLNTYGPSSIHGRLVAHQARRCWMRRSRVRSCAGLGALGQVLDGLVQRFPRRVGFNDMPGEVRSGAIGFNPWIP